MLQVIDLMPCTALAVAALASAVYLLHERPAEAMLQLP